MINDKYYSAFNRFWHVKCFTCKVCNKGVNPNCFIGHDNWPCHKQCYINEYARKCQFCHKIIEGEYMKIGDYDIHLHCVDGFMENYKDLDKEGKSKEQEDFESLI